MITPANALKFSIWLAAHHPQAFRAVLDQVSKRPVSGVAGFGAAPVTYLPARRTRLPAILSRGRFGRLGDVWGDIDSGTYDPNALRTQVSAEDLETFTPSLSSDSLDVFTPTVGYEDNPTLWGINADTPATGFNLSGAAANADTSGGFWSSLGAGLSSIGSGLSSAIGTVAGAVFNPNTLTAAGNLAATVIKANGANSQQQALLQAQVSRTASGAGAYPITYGTNPATGQTVPMIYNPSTGQYQPTSPLPSASSAVAGSLTPYVPYILIGGGLLIAALVFRK